MDPLEDESWFALVVEELSSSSFETFCGFQDQPWNQQPTVIAESQEEVGGEGSSAHKQSRSHTAPLRGILRRPSWMNRQQSDVTTAAVSSAQSILPTWRFLWKSVSSLLIIPLLGYILSQWYPSSVLLHFTVLCFIYGLVDLLDQDPTFSLAGTLRSSSSTPLSSNQYYQYQGRRQKRVEFVEGTKFYRMPKPMSRRQKQAACEQQLQQQQGHQPSWANAAKTRSETQSSIRPSLPRSISEPVLSRIAAPTSDSSFYPIKTTTTTIDWEATNRLLKSIIEGGSSSTELSRNQIICKEQGRPQDGKESFSVSENDFENAQETIEEQNGGFLDHTGLVGTMDRACDLPAPLSDPETSGSLVVSSYADRVREEEKENPLDDSSASHYRSQKQQQIQHRPFSPLKLIGSDSAMARMRLGNDYGSSSTDTTDSKQPLQDWNRDR